MVDFDAIIQKTKEVERRQAALEKLWDRATDTSVKITDMPKAQGDGKRAENTMIDMADVREDLRTAERELEILRDGLRRRMGCLTKWQHRDIIKKRFLEGKHIEQVMDEIGYEWTQTHRYLTEAKEIINSQP